MVGFDVIGNIPKSFLRIVGNLDEVVGVDFNVNGYTSPSPSGGASKG